jgi:hypothetical protein
MAAVLAELERRYGGVPEYLIAGGAEEQAINEVRRRLRH